MGRGYEGRAVASRAGGGGSRGPEAPRPGVLASLTEQHFLTAVRRAAEPVSRAEIAQVTGLSKPAVSTAAARLLERGLIEEVGIRQGRRGGVATLLRINAGHGHSLAVAVQSDAVRLIARDLRGSTLVRAEAALAAGASRREVLSVVQRQVADVEERAGSPLRAVAVSLAGPVDARTGRVVELERAAFPAGHLDPHDDLDLEDLGPLVVDNDVNWASLAEHQDGSAKGLEDFVYVYCGAGIGAALFLGGRLHRGRGGLGGEIGYLRASPTRDLTEAIADLGTRHVDGYGLDVAAVDRLLTDPGRARDAQEVVDLVAAAVVNLTIAVNPSAVLLAGPWTHHAALRAAVEAAVQAHCLDRPVVSLAGFHPLRGASEQAHRLACEQAGLPVGEGAA